MAYIYKIENQINHKVYIGKTSYSNPNKRWIEHQKDSKNPNRNHRALYRALNKYGIENFTFSILEETNNPEEREMDYIQEYNSYHFGYNETLGGDGGKYLQLPEQEVCKYYLTNKNLLKTANYFACDVSIIKRILYKYNIAIVSREEVLKAKCSKPVAKIDKITNEIIEIYPSIMEAERQNNCHSHIKDVCNGKRKTAGGFIWKII